MPTGKPDFNLNSYGVKYLSKEEVQEFLEKRQGESIRSVGETKTKPLGVSGKPYAGVERERTSTSGLKQGEYKPSVEGRKQIDATLNTPKEESEPKSTPTNLTISAPNAAGDEELQGGTRSVFNSPTYGSKQVKPKTEKPKKEHLGSNVGEKNTDKIQSVDVKGNKRSIANIGEIKEGEERSKPTGSGSESKIGIKKPSKLGDAPANVKGKESKVGQKKVRVGVGEKAHEELERRDGVGEKRYAADPKSPYSKRTERREQKEQTQARKLGIAQSKLQEAKRRKQIEALGTAKKSNDIITEMNIMKLNLMKKDDPCWEGYEAIGMKDKDGKQVPNCVPKGDKKKAEEEKKPLNKPMRDDGNKKFKVYVRDPSTGNIVTVRFGDPNMEIKRDSPERRSSFRARHKCSEQKDITSAAYWSCKMWEKTSSVSDNIGKSADETIFKAISLKLDLMNKKDDWDKNERENERRSRGGGGSPDYNKMPFGVKQDMLHEQAVGRSGKGLKGKKINPKKQTFGEDAEEYGKIYDRQNETLKSQAEEIIFKAISLKLDLMKDGSPVPSAPYGTTIQRLRDGKGSGTRRQAARASAEDAYKKDHPEEDEDDFVRN